MRNDDRNGDADGLSGLDEAETQVLSAPEERSVLNALGECKAKLAEALSALPGGGGDPGVTDAEALAHYIARLRDGNGQSEARLGALARRYAELRSRLALANMRLVAHVAKRFRDRGIGYSDLIQEGICGLLEAIDRFDLGRETKLATYATWWIRQSMQRAVAAGAYPVRLSPRHLRQLAQNQEASDLAPAPRSASAPASTEMILRIRAATRPTISLNATTDDSGYTLLQTIGDPDTDRNDVDLDEALGRLLVTLRPREQKVLELRFGLSGGDRLSLSQVGQVMEVSKERVRQIQDRALEKLRAAAVEEKLADSLFGA